MADPQGAGASRSQGPGAGLWRCRAPRAGSRIRGAGIAWRSRLSCRRVSVRAFQPAHRRIRWSEEKRMRFLIEVTEAVRAHWPARKPLFVRLSVEDHAGLRAGAKRAAGENPQ